MPQGPQDISPEDLPTHKHTVVPGDDVKEAAILCIKEGKRVDEADIPENIRSAVRSLLVHLLKENDPKSVEVRIKRFYGNYSRLKPEDKIHCFWPEVQRRLLANDGHYLRLAEAMHQGGILFGIDEEGNPLIADAGEEPIMKNLTYGETRDTVYFADKEKTKPTGYEMFPAVEEEHQKGSEMLEFENFTQGPFIGSYCSGEGVSCSSWLDSGEDPARAVDAYFDPQDNRVSIWGLHPMEKSPIRGVRRLLRVRRV